MKVKLDASEVTTAYTMAFRRLQQLEGFDHREVLRGEAGVILKTWAGRTKVGTEEKAQRRARSGLAWKLGMQSMTGNQYGITVNDGSRGGEVGMVWHRTDGEGRMTKKGKQAGKPFQMVGMISDGGTFTPSNLHYRKNDWNQIRMGAQLYAGKLPFRLLKSVRSLGLSRQSVVQIALDLGIDLMKVKGGKLNAAGYAKAMAAIASNGTNYKNGTGDQGGDLAKCFVDLRNSLPTNQKLGMDTELLRIVAGRAKYIEMGYQKGAFDSMKRTIKAFPNLLRDIGLDMPAPPDEAVA